ncbi:hypothetical protein [Aeromicrobium sp.]|uniref:hypothetical protein n=1 Tax=Aeromicrobium sp. TaxID=1871063 RepID=UPI002FCA96BB
MSAPYRVWHIPQIPMEAFHVEVPDLPTALIVWNALSDYDLFQFENRVKPDYSNASGIQEFAEGEWSDVDDYELQVIIASIEANS